MVSVTIVPNVVFPDPSAQSIAKCPAPEKKLVSALLKKWSVVSWKAFCMIGCQLESLLYEISASQEGGVLELDCARLVKPTRIDVGDRLADLYLLTAEVASPWEFGHRGVPHATCHSLTEARMGWLPTVRADFIPSQSVPPAAPVDEDDAAAASGEQKEDGRRWRRMKANLIGP